MNHNVPGSKVGERGILGSAIRRIGRIVALVGLVLPLLSIGGLKFTQVEIEALKPMIGGTPWLAWMYPVFGEAGASYLLGVTEIVTALLLIVSPWSPRAGLFGGGRRSPSHARCFSPFLRGTRASAVSPRLARSVNSWSRTWRCSGSRSSFSGKPYHNARKDAVRRSQ